ncbi:hypothetical protein VPH35_007538 [Triticum aestivum]
MAVHKKHPKVHTIHEDKGEEPGGGSRKELSDLQFTFATIFSPAGLLFHHQGKDNKKGRGDSVLRLIFT